MALAGVPVYDLEAPALSTHHAVPVASLRATAVAQAEPFASAEQTPLAAAPLALVADCICPAMVVFAKRVFAVAKVHVPSVKAAQVVSVIGLPSP